MTATLVIDAEALYKRAAARRGRPRCAGHDVRGWWASPPVAPGWPSACSRPGPARPHGVMSSAMHRDDFASAAWRRRAQTQLDFDVNGAHIVHPADDVLYTGRTIRAVLNELFDYGRPASVQAGGAGRPRRARAADAGRLRRARGACRRAQSLALRARCSAACFSSKVKVRLTMLYKRNPQLNKNGELIHLLSIEGLPRQHPDPGAGHRERSFVSVNDREVKKVPLLRGRSVFNLFFENSTRTRTTFEIAATRLSADVINLDIARSSASPRASRCSTPSPT
jgi:hypothetical protein